MDILEAARVIARTNNQAIIQKAKEVAYAFDLQCLKEAVDDFEDLSIAYLMIIADFYDNRNLYADYKATTLNKGIETILNLHCRNFV